VQWLVGPAACITKRRGVIKSTEETRSFTGVSHSSHSSKKTSQWHWCGYSFAPASMRIFSISLCPLVRANCNEFEVGFAPFDNKNFTISIWPLPAANPSAAPPPAFTFIPASRTVLRQSCHQLLQMLRNCFSVYSTPICFNCFLAPSGSSAKVALTLIKAKPLMQW